MSDSLRPHGLQPSRLQCPWDSLRKNTGVGCQVPIQGNLPNSGIKPRSPALQVDSLLPEPPGKPKNTGWVAYPFSRRTSQPRNRTRVSRIAGGFFFSQSPRNPHNTIYIQYINSLQLCHWTPLLLNIFFIYYYYFTIETFMSKIYNIYVCYIYFY